MIFLVLNEKLSHEKKKVSKGRERERKRKARKRNKRNDTIVLVF
jgi:hypothetical protein